MTSKHLFQHIIPIVVCLLGHLLGPTPAQSQGELKTWVQATEGMWGASTNGIAVSPNFANDSLVLVGTGKGVFRSADAGLTWEPSANLEEDIEYDAVRLSPTFVTDQTAFTWSANRLYRSTDAGQHWTLLYTALADIKTLALSPNLANDHTAILGTYGQGAYLTTDGGTTWSACNNGITDSYILSAAFSPSYTSDHTVMLGTHGKGFFLSEDSSASWVAANSGLPTYTNGNYYNISSITPSPAFGNDQIIFARVLGYLYRTTNAGTTWVQVSSLPLNLVSIAIPPDFDISHKAYASIHYYLGDGKYIYTSSDSGATWSQLASNMLVGQIALGTTIGGDDSLFGTSDNGVARSDDEGLTWALHNEGLDVVQVVSLAVSPAYENDQILFAVGNNRLYRSTNGAETWSQLYPENFLASLPPRPNEGASSHLTSTSDYYYSVAISPAFASDETVFVGGRRGVFRSVDAGETWELVSSNFPDVDAISIGISPDYANDQRVFVGLNAWFGETNIYFSNDGGDSWLPTGLEDGGPIYGFVFSPQYSQDSILFAIDSLWGEIYSSSGDYSVWIHKITYTNQAVDLALSPGYPDDQTYYTLENGPGIWITTDDGETTSLLVGFAEYTSATDLLMSSDFAEDHTFYVSFFDEVSVIRSTDSVDNWEPVNRGLQGNFIHTLAFLGSTGDLIAGTLASGVWVYRNVDNTSQLYLPLITR